MARIRSVHPDICISRTMARVSAEEERTFVRLWTHCDDEGRCLDLPELIASMLYPLHADMDAAAVDAHLDRLAEVGLVVRYEVHGEPFVAVTSWKEYQHPQKRKDSKFPPPPAGSMPPPGSFRDGYATDPVHVSSGGEGSGEERRSSDDEPRREDVDELCDLLVSLVVGNGCKKPTVTRAWRDEARRLLDRDNVPLEEARRVMTWALHDNFWKSNVLSMPKFRAKYDRLRLQSQTRGGLRAVQGEKRTTTGRLDLSS